MGSALAFCLFLAPGLAHGDAKFEFVDPDTTSTLDGGGVGGSKTVLDSAKSINVKLTTVEVVGSDGTKASEGASNVTNVPVDSLGVNTGSVTGTNEARDFNLGEQWVFSFDVDVELVNIDFAGWNDTQSQFTLSFSDATPDIVLSGDVTDDTFNLSNTSIAAGVEITMAVTNLTGDNEVRVTYLTVSAVPPPLTGANLKWTGIGGNDWNTSLTNWADTDNANTPIAFVAGDNVTIDTDAAIAVDAGGITSGFATVSAPGTVSFSGGNLTTETFSKSGAGTLSITNLVNTGTSVVSVADGILQVDAGGGVITSGLSLTGGSTTELVINDTTAGAFTNNGVTALGASGGRLRVNTGASLSLGAVSSSAPNASFDKRGDGVLTVAGAMGSDDFPVDLHLEAGSLNFDGNFDLHLSNSDDPNSINGPITLNRTKLYVHGVNFQGPGSIESLFSTSRIAADFNAGHNTINVPVILTANLTAEARPDGTNGSSVTFGQIISGSGSLIKDGPGNVFLQADNTYLGDTTVLDGNLQVGGGIASTSGTLGGGAVNLTAGTISFIRSDDVVISNIISGAGNVTVRNGSSGSTELSGLNDYTGVTTLSGGTLVAPVLANANTPSSIGAANGLPATLILGSGGVLIYTGAGADTDREFALGGSGINGSGGTILSNGTGALNFTYAPGTVGADGTGTATRILTLGGTYPGTNTMALSIGDGINSFHSVVKSGSTTWSLSGNNTYSGDTVINSGTLELGASTDLTDTSIVRINGATSVLQLADGVTDSVEELWIDGVQMAAGTWGDPASSPDHPDDAHFNGTGKLLVNTGPSGSDYDTWAGPSGYNLTGGPTEDDDNDGLSNEKEYAFGLNPTTGSSVNPIVVALDRDAGTFSYTRRDPAEETGLNYTIWTSTNLSSWTEDDTAIQDAGTTDGNGNQVVVVTLTTPPTDGKFFVQVKASE